MSRVRRGPRPPASTAQVCDREVAEAVCDLVGCVRLEHLLPPGEETVRAAAERGILTRGWGQEPGQGTEAWDPRMFRPSHARPRYNHQMFFSRVFCEAQGKGKGKEGLGFAT